MSNFETMKAAYNRTHEIQSSTTMIASALRDMVAEDKAGIRADLAYSPMGQAQEIEESRQRFGKDFIHEAKKMREEFDRSVIAAQNAAELVLIEQPKKPTDTTIATFNRQLADLKLGLLLSTDAEKAFESVHEFTASQKDPYLAQQLIGELPGFIERVTTVAGSVATPAYKLKLRQTYDGLKDVSMSPEQKEAERIFATIAQQHGKALFLPGGVQMNAIRTAVGDDFASFANNPHDYGKAEE